MSKTLQPVTYRKFYNALNPEVEEVYGSLQKVPGYQKLLYGAVEIIKQYGAEEYLGIFLKHRHFTCKPNHVFLEQSYTPNKEHAPLLVTRPIPVHELPENISAHRFSLDKTGTIQPLEYSTDRNVRNANLRLMKAGKFLKSLGNYLDQNQLLDYLGIGVYAREGNIDEASLVFMEESDIDTFTSTIRRVGHITIDKEVLVPTLWTFAAAGNGCCTTQTNCVSYCSRHDSPGSGYCGHRKSGSGHIGCV